LSAHNNEKNNKTIAVLFMIHLLVQVGN